MKQVRRLQCIVQTLSFEIYPFVITTKHVIENLSTYLRFIIVDVTIKLKTKAHIQNA